MMRIRLLLGFLACLAAFSLSQTTKAEEGHWRVFRSEAGGFAVEMPGEPSASQTVDKSLLGEVTAHLFTVALPSEEFTAEYSDLPHLALALGGPSTILKKAKQALLEDVGGEEVAFRLMKDSKNARAELSYVGSQKANPGVTGFARFYLRGERLYVLHIVLSNGQRIDPERVIRFLGSFALDS